MKTDKKEQTERDRLMKILIKRQTSNFKERARPTPPPQRTLDKTGELHASLDYLLGIQEALPMQVPVQVPVQVPLYHNHNHQHTLKHYVEPEVQLNLPSDWEECSQQIATPEKLQAPAFGCLKNGTLPTYREYKHRITQKAAMENSSSPLSVPLSVPLSIPLSVPTDNSVPLSTPFVPKKHTK